MDFEATFPLSSAQSRLLQTNPAGAAAEDPAESEIPEKGLVTRGAEVDLCKAIHLAGNF